MPTMTRAEYAKHQGVSGAAVTQWAAKGRILCDKSGRVLVDESDRMLAETRDPRGKHRAVSSISSPSPRTDPEPEQPDFDFDGTLVDANKRDRIAAAKLKELELA